MKKNIAILADSFITWGGGKNFISILINGFLTIPSIKIFVMIPKRSNIKKIYDFIIWKYNNFGQKYLLPFKQSKIVNDNKYNNYFKDDRISTNKNVKIIYYNDTKKDLLRKLFNEKIDLIFPSAKPLGNNFPVKWIGYLADCRHKYDSSFTLIDKLLLDVKYKKIVCQASMLMVNSENAKNDFIKYYNADKNKIFKMEYIPIAENDWLIDKPEIIQKYNLPEKYFLISNQFWKHKSHITVFEALAKLIKSGIKDIYMVFTGEMYDDGNIFYTRELKNRIIELEIEKNIFLLGYIPKIEQIEIMKNAIAIIQPSLFEGGPGGGAVYNALSLRIPVIVSDIPINLEIKHFQEITFFRAGSSEDLYGKILEILKKDNCIKRKDIVLLNNERKGKFKNFLISHFIWLCSNILCINISTY